MKFNLKNRPTLETDGRGELYDPKAKEWFEGFEKELRKRLANPSGMRRYDAVSNFIEEILGE